VRDWKEREETSEGEEKTEERETLQLKALSSQHLSSLSVSL
jgi:hypothetical protein